MRLRRITARRSLDGAFSKISANPHPLAAYIFSQDPSTIDRFTSELSFCGGAVNQVNLHLLIATMPFGGVGLAGI
jgi:aldehyde dehydrogenase (NAD+)